MASRCAHASRRSLPRPVSASPRSRRSVPHRLARRFSKPGSSWKYRNAVIASPARSCPQRRCLSRSPNRKIAISTTPCQGISVAAALMRESVRESSAWRTVRRTTRKESDMTVNLSRRQYLSVSAALGGGLLIGFTTSPSSRNAAGAAGATFAPNAFIRIGSDGQIVLIMPYVEMGQGTYTSIPMLIAEELEVDLKQVRLEHAPPNEKLYANPLLGVQATGNSNAIRGAWKPLREAGATARTMLVSAAAKRWNVDPASCRAQSGEELHAPTGRRIKHGELAAAPAPRPVPDNVVLKR